MCVHAFVDAMHDVFACALVLFVIVVVGFDLVGDVLDFICNAGAKLEQSSCFY